jgi:hypothetical protein
MFAIPILIIVALAIVILVTSSKPRLAATLIEPDVLVGLLVLQGLLLVWRLLAVGASLMAPDISTIPRPW